MVQKRNDVEITSLGEWDTYQSTGPDKAAERIFKHAVEASAKLRNWYRASIRGKRWASFAIRILCYGLVFVGAALPICAAILDAPIDKLRLTQSGVAALVAAGLLFQADHIFGLSSGWMRYTTAVTSIQIRTQKFELEWAAAMLARAGALDNDAASKLFDLARCFVEEIDGIQEAETKQWVSEFNASLAMMGELIRSQRESTDRALEQVKAAKDERAKSTLAGGIEITFKFSAGPEVVLVTLDDNAAVAFEGAVWAKNGVTPGLHHLSFRSKANPARYAEKLVDVPPGKSGCAVVELLAHPGAPSALAASAGAAGKEAGGAGA